MPMNANGIVFYRGPSMLTGDPIVAVITGLATRSHNPKTGPMLQAWILRADLAPMAAARANTDDAVCGDCGHRGDGGYGRSCYVTLWLAPNQVYKQLAQYPVASWPDTQRLLAGRHVRLGAYGDPAALPFEIWRMVLTQVAGWTGYTHQWRACDLRFQAILMASVDNPREFQDAQRAGWRTFRVRSSAEALMEGAEVACPASAEEDHRATCQECELCRGQANPARSVSILAHGNPGQVAHFYKNPAFAVVGEARA